MRAASLVLAVAACAQPHPLVICHNANCAEPVDAELDDTLAALTRSLALVDGGRPVIDGVELDSFYRASDGACLYAHDPTDASETTPAIAPAEVVAAHFAEAGPLTWSGGTFHVLLELKPFVGPTKDDHHTPAQRILHAECAWQIYQTLADAAVANGRDVAVELESFAPELIAALIATAPADPAVPYTYGAIQSLPPYLDHDTHSLDSYAGLPIAFVEFHDQWISDDQDQAVRSLGARIHLFMFSATTETFAAIRRYDPDAVSTSEARLMRRWIER
ncbi:MAG: hypothetical protein ACM31C_09565 [Acidobacteriota bacterium]